MSRWCLVGWMVLSSLTLACGAELAATETKGQGFVHKVFRKSKYVVFVPRAYDGSKALPTILFLHGRSQSGKDGLGPIRFGLARSIRKKQDSFPFIVVFPQSQQATWDAKSADGKRAMAILSQVQKDYRVDPRRIYLTGYSMGGVGTFSLAAAHPQRFAAIVPICGARDPRLAPRLKHLPCWCFVGDADGQQTVYLIRSMVRAIQKSGGQPIYQEFKGVGHRCWPLVYDNPDVFKWLLQQRRPSVPANRQR